VNMKETYKHVKNLLDKISNNKRYWNVCGYLKFLIVVLGTQLGNAKCCDSVALCYGFFWGWGGSDPKWKKCFLDSTDCIWHDGSWVSCHSFHSLCLCFNNLIQEVHGYLCNSTCWQPICWSNRGCKVMHCSISFYLRVNFDSN
jgi:hypothetical protein